MAEVDKSAIAAARKWITERLKLQPDYSRRLFTIVVNDSFSRDDALKSLAEYAAEAVRSEREECAELLMGRCRDFNEAAMAYARGGSQELQEIMETKADLCARLAEAIRSRASQPAQPPKIMAEGSDPELKWLLNPEPQGGRKEPPGFWEWLESNREEVLRWPGWMRGGKESNAASEAQTGVSATEASSSSASGLLASKPDPWSDFAMNVMNSVLPDDNQPEAVNTSVFDQETAIAELWNRRGVLNECEFKLQMGAIISMAKTSQHGAIEHAAQLYADLAQREGSEIDRKAAADLLELCDGGRLEERALKAEVEAHGSYMRLGTLTEDYNNLMVKYQKVEVELAALKSAGNNSLQPAEGPAAKDDR